MQHSDKVGELAKALAAAQGSMQGAKRDANNPFFNKMYADLAACWEACRTALSENGLAVIQTIRSEFDDQGEHLFVDTMLAHESGEWVKDSCEAPVAKPDAQGYGSAITYFRRYALSALVGIAPEDDDGEAATGRNNGEQVATRKARTPKPKAEKGTPPPDDTPQHVALLRQSFKNYCQHRAKHENRDLAGVLEEEKHFMFERYSIKTADDASEKLAGEMIDYFDSEVDKMEGR